MGNRTPRTARTPTTIINNPPVIQNISLDPFLAAVQASIAEAPLPLGWEETVTPKGVTYYIDHVNGITTYQDPRLNSVVVSANINNSLKKKKEKDTKIT